MSQSRAVIALALIAPIAVVSPARAAPDDEHTLLHAGIVLGGALAYVASETVLKEELAPARCRWCDDHRLDRGVRDAVVWKDPQTADTISDVTAFAVAPAVQLGLLVWSGRREGDGDDWLADGLAVTEAVVVAGVLNQTVKFLVGRQRPYAHVAAPGSPAVVEDNLSFYSGHTTLGFTLAAATGTVAQMRGYDAAPWIWTSGVALASAAAYLRMAGDRHWFSDVAVGAAIGTAVGIAIPRLAHRHLSEGDALNLTAAPGLVLLSGRF